VRLIRVICVLDSDPNFSSNVEARDLEAETREVRSTNVRDDTDALSNCGTIEHSLGDNIQLDMSFDLPVLDADLTGASNSHDLNSLT